MLKFLHIILALNVLLSTTHGDRYSGVYTVFSLLDHFCSILSF